jgi:hypothetical protein
VALSSNGSIAVVGGPGDNENDGAAWVFARRGSTWTQQGEKLTGGGEQNFDGRTQFFKEHIGGRFGASVALSAHGDTGLIGGPRNGSYTPCCGGGISEIGAAWVFTRSRSTWTQQGEKLRSCDQAAIGCAFGASAALSADGNTALVGVPQNEYEGKAVAFIRSGSSWTEQGELRKATAGEAALGKAVAVSSDGNTALVGRTRPTIEELVPAALVFARQGSTWTQPFPPLACAGEGCEGLHRNLAVSGVALSGDAGTALVGTAVYVDTSPHK